MVLVSPLQPGMEEAQLRAPREAVQCLCSLRAQGVLLGLTAFVLEIAPGLGGVPQPLVQTRFSAGMCCTDIPS